MHVLRMLLDGLKETSEEMAVWKVEAWKALDFVTSEGYSVLHISSKRDKSAEVTQFLVKQIMLRKAWADTQQTKPGVETRSFLTFETLKELKCKGGYTAFLLAVKCFNLNVAKYLVKQGANLYAKTENLQNAMHIATLQEDRDTLEYLTYQDSDENLLRTEVDIRLRKPKDIDITNKLAGCFYHIWDYAATGNIVKIKMLVNSGKCSVNEQTGKRLNSVLHVAVEKAQVICVRELMAMGADPNIKNAAGKTPADVAAMASVIKDPRYESVIYRLVKGEGAEGFHDMELQALGQAYRPYVHVQGPPEARKESRVFTEEWTPEKRALIAQIRDKLIEKSMSVADAFELVDKDKDFCMEKVEFEALLLWLGIQVSTAQIAELLHSLDHHRTGRIEYAAVINHIREANKVVLEKGEEGRKSVAVVLPRMAMEPDKSEASAQVANTEA
jgi:hypothetical protein